MSIRTGHLVKLRAESAGGVSEVFPCALVVRGPYEASTTIDKFDRKITSLFKCVDILLPDGNIMGGVSCKLLERV